MTVNESQQVVIYENMDANDNKIVMLADPEDPQDAVNLRTLEDHVDGNGLGCWEICSEGWLEFDVTNTPHTHVLDDRDWRGRAIQAYAEDVDGDFTSDHTTMTNTYRWINATPGADTNVVLASDPPGTVVRVRETDGALIALVSHSSRFQFRWVIHATSKRSSASETIVD